MAIYYPREENSSKIFNTWLLSRNILLAIKEKGDLFGNQKVFLLLAA